jgi:hypothetical protein
VACQDLLLGPPGSLTFPLLLAALSIASAQIKAMYQYHTCGTSSLTNFLCVFPFLKREQVVQYSPSWSSSFKDSKTYYWLSLRFAQPRPTPTPPTSQSTILIEKLT